MKILVFATLSLLRSRRKSTQLINMYFFLSSQVGGESKTTFDDLLESLKQLEEEPTDLLPVEQNSALKFGGWGKNLLECFFIIIILILWNLSVQSIYCIP